MSALVIQTSGLAKTYSGRGAARFQAVAGVDLEIEAGGIHGYLGPNGSGKSTTLRMLVGLVRPTAGEIRLFGESVPEKLPEVIRRVGAVLDRPRFLGSLTGRQNLELLAAPAGITAGCIAGALARIGLVESADKRYRTYSLGMQQRLALAAALMREPELLILDEPMNGLDPAGMRQMRELLRAIAADGTTVLLSSHLLADVQQLCQSVHILDRGRLVASGAVEQVLAKAAPATIVEVNDTAFALEALTQAGFDASIRDDRITVSGKGTSNDIAAALVTRGVVIRSIGMAELPLEAAFLALTNQAGAEESRP